MADPAILSDQELLMRTLVLLVMITPVVLLPACSGVTPTASPERTLPPSPVATATPVPPAPTQQAMPTPEPTATPEPTPTPTSEPTPTPVEATPPREPAKECVVESCEPYQEIALYHDFSDEQSFSRLVPGTNKTFLVKDRRDGRMSIEVTEPSGAKWEAWAGDNPGAYGPIGQAPPPPTPEVPPAYCTEPHYTGRTDDRKTGVVIGFGTPRQRIFPERPYEMWYFRMPGDYFVSRRDARITEIDRQNQIITFQLNDGSIRKRRLTPNTQMVMIAHEVYAGMPYSLYKQTGGDLCDLEVGDVASILHPDEPESANPNPSLTDLWGVYIVQ